MLRRLILLLLAFLFLAGTPGWAQKKDEPKYKSIEPRHFDRKEGVELSQQFSEFLYAALKEELQKTKLFAEVIGEDEAVDAADAAQSFILEGTLVGYGKGSLAKEVIIGFGAGRRSLVVRFTLKRRSDNQTLIADREVKVRATSQMKENLLARAMASKLAGEVKNTLKK